MIHDVLEGVCAYVMRSIIQKFISEEYFTLEYLNSRIADIKTYCSEITNMPPSITINRLKGKLYLKISAAEMFNLVRYLGLIIGDKILEGDKYWKCINFYVKYWISSVHQE